MKKLLFLITVFLLSGTSSFAQEEWPYGGYDLHWSYGFFGRDSKHARVTWTENPNVKSPYNQWMYFDFSGKDQNGQGRYLMFCSEEQFETWKKNLIEMKNIFHKNDSIAKANSVSINVVKDLTEKFVFNGRYFYGGNIVYEIKPHDNASSDKKYAEISVKYIYDGKESTILMDLQNNYRLENFYRDYKYNVFLFTKEKEFDEVIDIFDWQKYQQFLKEKQEDVRATKKRVEEYRKKNEEEKKRQESLFD